VVGVAGLDTDFGVEALAGRDLLSRCLLLYDGPHGDCTFAFQGGRTTRTTDTDVQE
jgi:hypothetical protein